MTNRKRVGVLISGRGSNMAALIEACRAPDYPAEIVAVISNRPNAAGLDIARAAGVSAVVINHRHYPSREAFDEATSQRLHDAGVELVCYAGFMRIQTAAFIDAWRDRHLNIHPSLLPSFRGLDPHGQAIAAGVRLSGATVHFVRNEMDTGPIVAQAAVPVLPGDDAETLAARVLKAEHALYPHALKLVASGAAWVEGETVRVRPGAEVLCPFMDA